MLTGPAGENLFSHDISDLSSKGVEIWGITADSNGGQPFLHGCLLPEEGSSGFVRRPVCRNGQSNGMLSFPLDSI